MENKRSKFFKSVINTYQSSDIRWKNKEAKLKCEDIDNLKEKENVELKARPENNNGSTLESDEKDVQEIQITIEVEETSDIIENSIEEGQLSVTHVSQAHQTICDKLQEKIYNKCETQENSQKQQKEVTAQQNKNFNKETESEHQITKTMSRAASDELEPTITDMIPDEEMEVIRKSLEGENIMEVIRKSLENDDTEGIRKPVQSEISLDIAKNVEGENNDISLENAENVEGENNGILSLENAENVEGKNNGILSLENAENVEGENIDISLPNAENENKIDSKQKKRRKRRVSMKKSYVDFLSDEEDFVWDSTSWKDTDEESSSSTEKPKKKNRKKSQKQTELEDGKVGDKGLKKKRINNRVIAKEARRNGKSYVRKNGQIVDAKQMLANPCVTKKCGHNCEEISDEKRKTVFDYFWSLSPEKRKDWLVALSNKKQVKRKRVKDSGYRMNSFEYYINDGEGRRQVCLKFILRTLCISQKYVYYTLSNACHGISKEDGRGKSIPANKTTEEKKETVINFIKSLPALPSHYCRKDTTRLYLPVEFRNLKNLYRIYKEDHTSKSLSIVSENIFREIFNKEFNIGFHVPKKDKCLKCLRYETNPTEFIEEKAEHLQEKEASKKRLSCHRVLGKENSSILCASFDLQKVLNTPNGNSILLFYTRKYAVYNLCFYENVTREGYCYLWGESDGKRGGNEISSILEKYISIVDSRGTVKHLILYSDSCPGQNKNKIVLAAVHYALSKSTNIETIQLNYLLPGHTEMSVDSMHSVIENSVRNTTVWAPSQWLTICQIARKEVTPYHVEWLNHSDFKNYEEFSDKYFKGNLAGKISKVKIVTIKKSNTISIKYSMKEGSESEIIPVIAKQKVPNPILHKGVLPITKTKFKDLKKLCDTGVIPKIFHQEYLTLPSGNGKDCLMESDIEDGDSNESDSE